MFAGRGRESKQGVRDTECLHTFPIDGDDPARVVGNACEHRIHALGQRDRAVDPIVAFARRRYGTRGQTCHRVAERILMEVPEILASGGKINLLLVEIQRELVLAFVEDT